MHRSGESWEFECHSNFSGITVECCRVAVRCFNESGDAGCTGIRTQPAAIQLVPGEFGFSQPELSESLEFHAAGVSAVRLSAGKEFRVRVFAAGEPECGA